MAQLVSSIFFQMETYLKSFEQKYLEKQTSKTRLYMTIETRVVSLVGFSSWV